MSEQPHPHIAHSHSSTHLVAHQPTPAASRGDVVEIRVFWGDALLEVLELSPPREFFIGDAARADRPVDFTVPDEGFTRTRLVGMNGGKPVVCLPQGATAVRRSHGEKKVVAPIHATAESVVLDRDTSIDVRLPHVSFSLRLGDRHAGCPRTLVADADTRPLAFFTMAAFLGGALVASMAFFTPPLGLTDDDALESDRMYLIQQYLDAAAEREREHEPAPEGETSGSADAPQAPARGEAGKMGPRDAPAQPRRASGAAPGTEVRPATSRTEQIAEAREFGLAGMLASGIAGSTPAPWDDPGMGPLATAGGLFGSELGESSGVGGLSLGIGEGGGFRGNQIGLLSIGTCHGEECLGHFGPGVGRSGPGHVARAPTMRAGQTVVERGSLPPEVIQRVVRQSFGRFRGCYEAGLRGNPTLEGRVTARFVIARDGSVATVQSGGTDLPDASVVACVLRAYSSLTFPSPKDGIVTVTYPLTFSPAA